MALSLHLALSEHEHLCVKASFLLHSDMVCGCGLVERKHLKHETAPASSTKPPGITILQNKPVLLYATIYTNSRTF